MSLPTSSTPPLSDDTFHGHNNPVGLLNDYPHGGCFLPKDMFDQTSRFLRAHDDMRAWLPWVNQSAGSVPNGALYLLSTSPDLLLVIRHVANQQPARALAVFDFAINVTLDDSHVEPLLHMEFAHADNLDPSVVIHTISDAIYASALINNPNIPSDRQYISTRVNPAPVALSWGHGMPTHAPPQDITTPITPANPNASSANRGPILNGLHSTLTGTINSTTAVNGGGTPGHPYYHVTSGQIGFRKGGPILAQQLTDMVAGVTGVSKDSLLKNNINEATIRALSAAPEAALCTSTVTGMHSYFTIANAWSVSIWDLRYFIANHFNFPSSFNYVQLCPLTGIYETAGNALDAFQRSLRDLDEASKEQHATTFNTVAPAVFTFRTDSLVQLLANYMHLIFGLTLMRHDLQEAFVNVAHEMIARIRMQVISPTDLTRLFLLQAFAIFRAAMRDFLLHSGSIREPAEMATRLQTFRDMVLSDSSIGYLRILIRNYRDCHMNHQETKAYVASGLAIALAPVPPMSMIAQKKDHSRDDSNEQPSSKRLRGNRGGRGGRGKESTPSTYAPSSTTLSDKAPAKATASRHVDSTSTILICGGFNNINGCKKSACDLEHSCPPRMINQIANPRWTRLHAHYLRLHEDNGSLRYPPNAAFLQGQPWPPVANAGAGGP